MDSAIVVTRRGVSFAAMGQLVCSGASLMCSFGTGPSTFNATNPLVKGPTPAGVVTDITPANVPPFLMCVTPTNPQVATATSAALGVLTPQPCIPVIASPWAPGSPQVKIGGVPALDNTSTCQCAWGGVITVTQPGQATVTV
jgi:hypothetical protein